ncbi:MAG: hypothetical protein JWN73_1641 [Betaproteobacteria bacterium]|nr:hypothetical protein [Betaproteobacteria bacterium]
MEKPSDAMSQVPRAGTLAPGWSPVAVASLTWGDLLKHNAWPLVACVLFVCIGASPRYGIFAWFLAVPILLWAMFTLVRMAIRPRERKWRGLRLALWAAGALVIVAAQHYNDYAARQQGDAVVKQVQAHRVRTGAWPRELQEVGLDATALSHEWGLRYGASPGSDPILSYRAPGLFFDAWFYDFKKGVWEFHAD